MHFGTPVVPDENSTYHGWSNGKRSNVGTLHRRTRCLGPRRRRRRRSIRSDKKRAAQGGQSSLDIAETFETVEGLAAVAIAGGGDEDLRFDLTEPVDHAVDSEVG